MKYRLKQKMFSLTDSFDIEDGAGQLAYRVKGKFFSISSSQTLFDLQERPLLKIKRKYLSIMPACYLAGAQGGDWLVRKHFWPFWRSRFSVQTPQGELQIDGNLWQHEYDISQQGRPVARISKAWFSWTDSYGIEIFRPEWTAELLAVVIVVDRISHSGRNSNLDDD